MRFTRLELARALARMAGITGTLPELQLAGDVLPVANVHNMDDPPWHSKRGAVLNALLAPVAGQYGTLEVGAVAGTIVVVRRACLINATGSLHSFNAEFGGSFYLAAGGAYSAVDWDNRGTGGNGSFPPIDVRAGTTGTVVGFEVEFMRTAQLGQPVGTEGHVPCPVVLRPGDVLRLQLAQTNFTVSVEMYADVYEV